MRLAIEDEVLDAITAIPASAKAARAISVSRSCRPAFEGKNRVARQRLVYAALKAELDAGLHALALTTLTPEEDKKS